MIEPVHPGFVLILGVLLVPLLRNGKLKQVYLLLLPVVGAVSLSSLSYGTYWKYHLMDYTITLGRVDALSMFFSYAFLIIAFCAMLYSLHQKEDGHHMAAYLYAGSAVGVALAGDLLSLYVFWEVMAVTSAALIFYRRTKASVGAGMRYILVHATGGICLLGGIIMYMDATGSIAFNHFDFSLPGASLILLGFIINAAVPPLHAWLPDAYPESTITGIIFLMSFTTKSAIYVLIRGFSGLEILMWLGAIMAVYGVLYAMLQNDIRRLLSYHIVSQVGYMVAGVGMGTFLAINGATAHAFNNILFKGLLLMCAGAILYSTGKSKFSDLSGLYRSMPLVMILFMIGAFSISGVPFFNGFVSKPMIMAASGELHNSIVYAMLVGAGVGTFLCIGLKIPYFVFFGREKGTKKIEKLPVNMKAAMGIMAGLCILIGVYPQILYRGLPFPVEYVPFTAGHVAGEIQLLLFTLLGFIMLKEIFVFKDTIVLDIDWVYRTAGRWFIWFINNPVATTSKQIEELSGAMKDYLLWFTRNPQRSAALVVDLLNPRRFSQEELNSAAEEERQKFGTTIHRSPVGDSVTMVLMFLFVYMVYFLFRGSAMLQALFLPILAWVLFAGVVLAAAMAVVMLFVIPVVTYALERRAITE